MNPWLPEEGSGGSSAGPAAAVAAGLVGFAIGSETGGSIVDPSMRCGISGLRPTYGRVPRTGAMTLCWSLDKLGPMTRRVEDTMLVLHAISGPDPGDVASVPSRLDFDAQASVRALRVGYFRDWLKVNPATAVDRAAVETLKNVGMVPVELSIPDWPYGSLQLILFAEAAAAFEDLALSGGLDQLKVQTPDAWPNIFREARFLSAVDFVQADRLRRKVAIEMAHIFSQVDLLLVPSLRDEMLTITNFTGHPSLTLRAGFVEVSEARSDWAPDPSRPLPKFSPPRRVPHGITLIGRLFDEHTIFGGVTYTDAHVMLPGMLAVCVALVLGAAIASINVVAVPHARWLVAAVAPAAVCYLALQIIGWYVSSFIVKPNELVRERPYIAYNIDLTRQAYGLDRLSQREFPAEFFHPSRAWRVMRANPHQGLTTCFARF